MPAKRYWRVHSRRNAGDGSWHQFAELEFRAAPGGADQCAGGVASCSSGLQSGSADGVFANDGTTSWAQWSGSTDKWVAYDFGAGNAKDIVEVAIMGATGAASRSPGEFDVQWSDDGVAWTTEWSGSAAAYTTGAFQIFTKPSAVASRYWRVRGLTIQSGLAMSCAELELRETIGGADQCTGGTASASSTFSSFAAPNAVDNNTSTFWGSNGGVAASEWIAYDFGAAVTKAIVQASYTARNDSNFAQAPTSAVIESSPDGRSWLPRFTTSGLTWTQGSTNVMGDPAAPPAEIRLAKAGMAVAARPALAPSLVAKFGAVAIMRPATIDISKAGAVAIMRPTAFDISSAGVVAVMRPPPLELPARRRILFVS